MKTPLETYFDEIVVLTLERRKDRREHAERTLRKLGIDPSAVFWFFGPDKPIDHNGQPNGNLGCTTGHRQILDRIIERRTPRTLVLEDDFDIAFTNPAQCQRGHRDPTLGFRVDAQAEFAAITPQIPQDWELLYLGGHFADTPQKRVSKNVVKIGRMHTTSSYGITCLMAKKMAPSIVGIGPIDTLYSGFTPTSNAYIVDPRLFIQMAGYSDLMEKDYNPSHAMQDMNHLKAMDEGRTYG